MSIIEGNKTLMKKLNLLHKFIIYFYQIIRGVNSVSVATAKGKVRLIWMISVIKNKKAQQWT